MSVLGKEMFKVKTGFKKGFSSRYLKLQFLTF